MPVKNYVELILDIKYQTRMENMYVTVPHIHIATLCVFIIHIVRSNRLRIWNRRPRHMCTLLYLLRVVLSHRWCIMVSFCIFRFHRARASQRHPMLYPAHPCIVRAISIILESLNVIVNYKTVLLVTAADNGCQPTSNVNFTTSKRLELTVSENCNNQQLESKYIN